MILLLQPWVEDFYATDCRIQPIGLAYLAGSLKRRFPDLEVNLHDTLAGGGKRSIPWPGEFRYLKPYYGEPDSGPFSLFHHYYRFGQTDEEILAALRGYRRPLLIGISCMFTPYYRQSLALAALCKQVFPDVPVVMGGSHATLHPETVLIPLASGKTGEALCDFVLRGEGEESICDLALHLKGELPLSAVPNLVCYRNIPATLPPLVTPERTEMALPDFGGLPADEYEYDNRPMTFLITSRSCPHRCTFCSIHAVFGHRYDTRSVAEVVREIRIRYDQGIRHFDIEDDNFTFKRDHTMELLRAIIALDLPITFSAMNGLSYISLDAELLGLMLKAGFSTLNLALVSSDLMVRKFTQRPHTLNKFHEVTQVASDMGFRITAYFILGMPGQTVPEMWETLRVLAAGPCLAGASPFYFTPGSPIHAKEKDNPKIRLASRGRDPWFSARLTALDLEYSDFNRDDIYTAFRLTRVVNYVKQGLDEGFTPDDPYFLPALEVFRARRWTARSRKGEFPIPFSETLGEKLATETLAFQGYKTRRRMFWDPVTGTLRNGTEPEAVKGKRAAFSTPAP